MGKGGKEAILAADEVVAKAEIRAPQQRVKELQQVLGKKALEIDSCARQSVRPHG